MPDALAMQHDNFCGIGSSVTKDSAKALDSEIQESLLQVDVCLDRGLSLSMDGCVPWPYQYGSGAFPAVSVRPNSSIASTSCVLVRKYGRL